MKRLLCLMGVLGAVMLSCDMTPNPNETISNDTDLGVIDLDMVYEFDMECSMYGGASLTATFSVPEDTQMNFIRTSDAEWGGASIDGGDIHESIGEDKVTMTLVKSTIYSVGLGQGEYFNWYGADHVRVLMWRP